MKKLARIPALKYTAFALFCLTLSVCAASSAGFIYVIKDDLYTFPVETLSAFDAFAVSMRYVFGIVAVSTAVASLVLLLFLMTGAGYRKGSTKVSPRKQDKIYLEFVLAFYGGLIYGLYVLCSYILERMAFWNLFIICPSLLLMSCFIALIFITIAIRYKTDTLLTCTLFWRIALLFRDAYINFSTIWKALFFLLLYFGITFYAFYYRTTLLIIVWSIVTFIYCALLASCVIFIDQIKKGSKRIADGDLNYKIDTTGMYSEFTKISDNLNNINVGLSKAVEEKTKSERFRTELITNVSHDIKTPLTSIINYVDLLKRDDLSSEDRKQYLDVIDRQSSKLKKLIVDLVEASKAITGNIVVNVAPTNLNELLGQAVAEYSERFASSSLTSVVRYSDPPITVNADGRLIWRIFDNLMSNICKYSLPSTRVYIDVAEKDGHAEIVFKNISKSVLNVSADELVERFVRGDSSRSTEGSGLGLSIASSLAELQLGELAISVDGDLFKATLTLPLYTESQS